MILASRHSIYFQSHPVLWDWAERECECECVCVFVYCVATFCHLFNRNAISHRDAINPIQYLFARVLYWQVFWGCCFAQCQNQHSIRLHVCYVSQWTREILQEAKLPIIIIVDLLKWATLLSSQDANHNTHTHKNSLPRQSDVDCFISCRTCVMLSLSCSPSLSLVSIAPRTLFYSLHPSPVSIRKLIYGQQLFALPR